MHMMAQADGRVRRLEQPERGAGEGQRRGDGGAGAKAGSDLFSHCLRDGALPESVKARRRVRRV